MHDVCTKIGKNGRIIIPATIRRQLHLNAGDNVIFRVENDEVHILTPNHALKKIQDQVKTFMSNQNEPISLVDELISLRRKETERE